MWYERVRLSISSAVLMSLAHPGLCGLPRLLRHRLSAAALLLLLLHTATATATATAEEEVEAEKELPSRWWPEVEGRAKRSYLTDGELAATLFLSCEGRFGKWLYFQNYFCTSRKSLPCLWESFNRVYIHKVFSF